MMTSDRAAELVGDASLDLVFIDGDHSYEQTLRDIRNWLPKVRPGGILCGHDCEVRVTKENQAVFHTNRHKDSIESVSPFFVVNHPGVVLSVHEVFGGRARLWAEQTVRLDSGPEGRSTLWEINV